MKTASLRELKNRLSEYVRQARSGRGVLASAHGEMVAERPTKDLHEEESHG